MDRIQTRGGIPLNGEVTVQGSKNAALPLMAAAVLHPGKTVLYHCPHILDVEYMGNILRELGCIVFWEGGALVIDAENVYTAVVPPRFATKLRASVLLLGSLLGRFGSASLPYPGGCTIGLRPVDIHLSALGQLGAQMLPEKDEISLYAARGGMQGCEITLAFPSVGATENAILGAVRARGITVLRGCATEPEVVELCVFLNAKGARIRGVGGSVLSISGVDALEDSEYDLMPDRIVAGTYLLAAAGTRGKICLHRVRIEHLGALVVFLRENGVRVETCNGTVTADAAEAVFREAQVTTAPYPGFPTDLQSQTLALLCGAKGESRVEETLFESRFRIAGELVKMGAQIEIDGQCATVRGPVKLQGAQVKARELRGGAALVTAGLMAQGTTVVSRSCYIRRGYEDICRDLAELGADIREVP